MPRGTRRRFFAIGGAVVLAAVLAACATFRNDYTFSQAQLQSALERKFPFNKRYMALFDIELSNPRLTLDAARNRVAVQFDARIDNQVFFRQPLAGRFALDSALRYDPETRSVVLQDPVVQQFDVTGLPAQYARQLSAVGGILAEQLLQGYPLHTFKPDELRLGGASVEPGTITVLPGGINVAINRP
jgi:hypothetical protein